MNALTTQFFIVILCGVSHYSHTSHQRLASRLLSENDTFARSDAAHSDIEVRTESGNLFWSSQSDTNSFAKHIVSRDRSKIAFVIDNHKVYIYEIDQRKIKLIADSEKTVKSLCFNPQGSVLCFSVFGHPGHAVVCYENGHQEYLDHSSLFVNPEFLADGAHIVTCPAGDNALGIVAITNFKQKHTLSHEGTILSARLNKNRTKIVTSDMNTIKLWDTESGKELWSKEHRRNDIIEAQFSEDEKSIHINDSKKFPSTIKTIQGTLTIPLSDTNTRTGRTIQSSQTRSSGIYRQQPY